ncbi:glycoside hydrolase family 16 protein [Polychaeton citri CBS 116435]|uniref:Glycoside hydrolase family 16 protein n=1 Tax=Polychaeton citri CBS 116435 TaxID=1314669 RepID=A0A9P4Q034_9PEZI|nr:glycoside hydrolase family 16 protein [Polychaeton citri CBS 116435]
MRSSFLSLLALGLSASAQGITRDVSDCSCGFRDPGTDQLFTQSLIVYFNETAQVDTNVFEIEDYLHKKEEGWKSTYIQGADPSNLVIGNNASLGWQNSTDGKSPSLQLFLDAATQQHVVVGSGLRTLRRDIQYGSFRASMRSAHPFDSAGGSALSMMLNFNSSDNMNVDLMNMNDPSDARVGTLVNGEGPNDSIVTNYTILGADDTGYPPLHPFDFMTVRMDWNKTDVNFWIGENNTRSITKKDRTLPKAPQPLYLRHWSTGDKTYMEGPPTKQSVGNVAWVRAFFNSSLMTTSEHKDFDDRCFQAPTCLTDDETLRGQSAFTAEATKKWKEPKTGENVRLAAAIVAAACSSFGIFALLNVFLRRTPWHLLDPRSWGKEKSSRELRRSVRESLQAQPGKAHDSEISTLAGSDESIKSQDEKKGFSSPKVRAMKSDVNLSHMGPSSSKVASSNTSIIDWSGSTAAPTPNTTAPPSPNMKAYPFRDSDEKEMEIKSLEPIYEKSAADIHSHKATEAKLTGVDYFKAVHHDGKGDANGKRPEVSVNSVPPTPGLLSPSEKQPDAVGAEQATAFTAKVTTPPKPPRIDYLAGLVAIACIGVTLRHFILTFWPYVAAANGPTAHYPKVEKWLAIFLGDYFLTPLWIGPFFLTSCRFLTGNYLRTGNLDNLAQKITLRAFRLLIPVVVIVTLEYFLISMGLTGSLVYLPSVTWATWPFVTPFPNFGSYMSDLIQLAYFIPTGAPEIISHYCVGVLWTMPVQLQSSYMVFLGAVLVRNIKTPWKRIGFYIFCFAMSWYARSWAACHWLGLGLSDLEVTYKWIKHVQARWYLLYPLLTSMSLLALATPLIMVWSHQFNWQMKENSIHPDQATGQPIVLVDGNTYPDYFIPTLAHVTFAISLQIIVEMSKWVQAFLSLKVVLWIHPHIMTIYLTHGFIFWSWGAWVCVTLHSAGIPYWANLIITALTSYTVIAMVAKILTPWIEFITRATLRNVWRWASEAPIPKRQTTAPFNKELILNRQAEPEQKGE